MVLGTYGNGIVLVSFLARKLTMAIEWLLFWATYKAVPSGVSAAM
jgi:hypothetical protein